MLLLSGLFRLFMRDSRTVHGRCMIISLLLIAFLFLSILKIMPCHNVLTLFSLHVAALLAYVCLLPTIGCRSTYCFLQNHLSL